VDGIEMAVVVIARSDRRVDLLTSRRLNHLVGVLQGQVGFGRVLVLTENELEGFLYGTGVTEVRYDRDNIQARFPQLGALLEDMVGGYEPPDRSPPFEEGRPLLERLGLTDGGLRPEMLVGGGVLLLLVVVLIVLAWQFAGGAANADPGSDGGRIGAGAEEGPSGPEVATAQRDDGPVAAGDVGSLPASCVVDTSEGSVLPEVVACDGIGGLRVEGYHGPWFRDLATVAVDQGVVGHLELAGSEAAATTVPLSPLAKASVPGGSGVSAVRLQFSSDGQRATFHQASGQGGDQVVLTFSLDL
jgi:hypothetical protein